MVTGTILQNFHGRYWRLDLQKKIKKSKTIIGCKTWNKNVLIQSYHVDLVPKPILIIPEE